MFGDPLFWILVLPGLLLGVYAQSQTRQRWSSCRKERGLTGFTLLNPLGFRGGSDSIQPCIILAAGPDVIR
jgi:hypothetical protein